MTQRILVAGVFAVVAGCSTQGPISPEYDARVSQSIWPAIMNPGQVTALSPDECKAILLAQAVLEARDGQAVHARYKVARYENEWSVHVAYIAPRGSISLPGNFCTVYITDAWSVKKIVGGA